MWDWSKLTCAKRMEFSGMIHWLTINNHPSNPQQPPATHPFPTNKCGTPGWRWWHKGPGKLSMMSIQPIPQHEKVHIEPPTAARPYPELMGSVHSTLAANLSTFATLIIPIYAHPLQEVGTHLKTVPQILTRRRLITKTTTRDIMLSIHSGIWRYELVASDHLPPWLARPGFATDAEELLCSQIQILFLQIATMDNNEYN